MNQRDALEHIYYLDRDLQKVYEELDNLNFNFDLEVSPEDIRKRLDAITTYIRQADKVEERSTYESQYGNAVLISKKYESKRLLVKPRISPYNCVIDWLAHKGCTGKVIDYVPSLQEIEEWGIDTVIGNLPVQLVRQLNNEHVQVFSTRLQVPEGATLWDGLTVDKLNEMGFTIHLDRTFVTFFACSLGDNGPTD